MAHGYYKNFTLTDIFNNPRLADKLPYMKYKEIQLENGKTSRRTSMQSFMSLVHSTAKMGARPFYKPLHVTRSGGMVVVDGKCTGNFDAAYENVYNSLRSALPMLSMTVNNADMIRSALKNGRKQALSGGKEPKLWLRAGSIKEIENMSAPQIQAFMQDVMRNLYFNDDFAYTQKQFGVQTNRADYATEKEQWIRKVGVTQWRGSYEQD